MKDMDEIFKQPNIMRAQYLLFIGQGAYLYRCGKPYATVVLTPGKDCDHVSVKPEKHGYRFKPDEIDKLKTLFFEPEELEQIETTVTMPTRTVHFWLERSTHDPHMDT